MGEIEQLKFNNIYDLNLNLWYCTNVKELKIIKMGK